MAVLVDVSSVDRRIVQQKTLYRYIYIYIYVCVCVCARARVRARARAQTVGFMIDTERCVKISGTPKSILRFIL